MFSQIYSATIAVADQAKALDFSVNTLEWGQKGTWFYDLDGNEFFLVEG